jgi:hypothetical protein
MAHKTKAAFPSFFLSLLEQQQWAHTRLHAPLKTIKRMG